MRSHTHNVSDDALLSAEEDISIIDLRHDSTAIDERAWMRQNRAAESIEINLLSCELRMWGSSCLFFSTVSLFSFCLWKRFGCSLSDPEAALLSFLPVRTHLFLHIALTLEWPVWIQQHSLHCVWFKDQFKNVWNLLVRHVWADKQKNPDEMLRWSSGIYTRNVLLSFSSLTQQCSSCCPLLVLFVLPSQMLNRTSKLSFSAFFWKEFKVA